MASRILVAQTAFLGDVVLTTSLLARLQEELPDAEVDVLVRAPLAPLLARQPGLAAVIPFDKRGRDRGLGGALRTAARLRARRYDLAMIPHRSLRTAFVVAAAGIRRRVGFAGSPGAWLYSEWASWPSSGHYVDRLNALSVAFSRSMEPAPAPALHVNPDAAARIGDRLTHAGIAPDARVAALAPGSVWATKRWSPEGYAEIVRRLTAGGWRVLLLGAEDDREAVERLSVHLESAEGVTDWVGDTDLPELVAALARADLFVGNDSGAMHVAGAVDTPVVVAFGPTVPELGFAPRGPVSHVAQIELECRPCHAHGPQRCPLDHHRCMQDLSADAVWQGVERVVGRAGA